MPFASANGIRLYYETAGRGPAVILVSGLGADGHFWYQQVPALREHFHVITVDNRCAGQSDKPNDLWTLRTMADDLRGLLDVLGLSRAHIVGASMGGFIAQEFALTYPDRMDRLVLCCTSHGGPRSIPIPTDTQVLLAGRTGDPERDLRTFLAIQFGTNYAETHARQLDEYVAWRVAHPQPIYAYHRQLAAALAHDTEDRLPALRCPVLILHGARDRVVPAENARRLAGRIPAARLHVFPDAGHGVLWECAEEVNRLMVQFLSAAIQGGGTQIVDRQGTVISLRRDCG